MDDNIIVLSDRRPATIASEDVRENLMAWISHAGIYSRFSATDEHIVDHLLEWLSINDLKIVDLL